MASASAPEALWRMQPVPLTYRFGEFTLARVKLPLLTLQAHFTEIERDPSLARLPVERMASERRGAYLPSLPVADAGRRVSKERGYLRYVKSRFPRYTVPLESTFDEYWSGFSPKSRSTIKRKVRRYCEHVGADTPWRAYATPEEVEAFFAQARTVSEKTYQERLLDAGLPSGEDFRREMLERAASGRARGYLLFHGPRPVAYLYCPVTDGVVGYQYLGFDPEYTSWSPGTVLQYFVFQDLFGSPSCRLFDFLEGETEQKRFYARRQTACADILYLPSTPRYWALALGHWFLEGASSLVVRTLDRLGLRRRLKQLFRSGVSRRPASEGAGAEE